MMTLDRRVRRRRKNPKLPGTICLGHENLDPDLRYQRRSEQPSMCSLSLPLLLEPVTLQYRAWGGGHIQRQCVEA